MVSRVSSWVDVSGLTCMCRDLGVVRLSPDSLGHRLVASIAVDSACRTLAAIVSLGWRKVLELAQCSARGQVLLRRLLGAGGWVYPPSRAQLLAAAHSTPCSAMASTVRRTHGMTGRSTYWGVRTSILGHGARGNSVAQLGTSASGGC